VHYPGAKAAGSLPRYVGRGNVQTDAGMTHPATSEPVAVEDNSKEGIRFLKLIRRHSDNPCLWPADEATARACGIKFQAVELVDGEYQPKAEKASKKG